MEPLTRIFVNGTEGSTFKVASDVSSTPVLAGLLTVLATLVFYQLILAPPATLRPKGSKIPAHLLSTALLRLDRLLPGPHRIHFGNPETKSFHGGARRITIRNEPVVLLAGDKADAKTFFYSRTLKFSQAYQRLLSGVPTEITAAAVLDQDKADVMFRENLKQAIRGERLAQLAPAMCEDTLRAVRAVPDWSKGKGVMDPKAFTFPLLFCMSMRTVGFADLADQPKIMKELADYYWAMERASSYWSTFFTKYPFRSSRIKEESGKLFAALGAAAYRRQQEGVVGDDSVAMLMEKGLGADYAVRFVVSSLFAAIINSTSMSLWLLLYLGANPEIRKRAHKEVVDYLDGMAATQGSDWKSMSTNKPRVEQLQVLSLNEWEHGFPTIETCLKETMRTILKITLFRLNMGDKKGGTAAPKVHGEEVRTGEFLGYWMGSTHFDSKIYSNPHRWDPERWARGEGSGDMDFLGWGAGMHPCTGMRFAKLEIKNFCTTILALMDWETIEPRTGKVHTLDTLPEPEYNCNDRSPAVPVSIRFTAY
ncbi:hypothetical protein V8E36_007561 [Tilletia maclaganii]